MSIFGDSTGQQGMYNVHISHKMLMMMLIIKSATQKNKVEQILKMWGKVLTESVMLNTVLQNSIGRELNIQQNVFFVGGRELL